MATPETMLQEIKGELAATFTELKGKVAEQETQLEELGGVKAETAQAIADFDTRLKELHEELGEAVKGLQRPGYSGGRERQKSLGEALVESPQYQAAKDSGLYRMDQLDVGSFGPYMKALSSSDFPELIREQDLGLLTPALAQPRIRDLFPPTPTDAGSMTYIETKGYVPARTQLESEAAAAQAVLDVALATGFGSGATATITSEDGETEETHQVASVDLDANTITLAENLDNTYAAGSYVRVKRLAPTPEGRRKPTGFVEFNEQTVGPATIAAMFDITRQAWLDTDQLQQYVNTNLIYELEMAEEFQVLYGDGSSPNMQGIMSHPDIQTLTQSSLSGTHINGLDAIRRAITMGQLSRYPVTGVAMHPMDWEGVEMVKDDDGRYLWVRSMEGAQERVFRIPIVVTDAIEEGEALTGAFQLGAQLWEREAANVRASESHDQNFAENKVTLRAEERLFLTITRPEAFVKVDFS